MVQILAGKIILASTGRKGDKMKVTLNIVRITILVLIVATFITGMVGLDVALPIGMLCVVVGIAYKKGDARYGRSLFLFFPHRPVQ